MHHLLRISDTRFTNHDSVPTNLTTWQWAFENPNSPPRTGAYINASTRERLPFADVEEQATQLSTVLVREHGLQPGDTVSLFATNTIWYPVAMWAAARAGARVNGASPAYGEEEMVHALKTAGTKFLFTLPEALEVVLKVAEQVGLSEDRIFLLEGQGQGVTTLQDLVMTGR